MPDLKFPFCVLDVDGTLTFAYDDFHPAIAEPVQQYRRLGGVVALLSGRLPDGMLRAVQWLGLSGGTLLGGGDGAVGARLLEDGSLEWLWQNALETAILLPGLLQAAEPGVALTPNRVIAVGNINKVMDRMAAITAPEILHIAGWDRLPDALAGEHLCGLRFILERERTQHLIEILSEIPEGDREIFDNAEFTSRHVGYSIRPAGSDKGSALARLMEIAGYTPAQTAAFGDWITDIPMLRRAGFSCAPADALKPVQEAASRVSAHTIRDGWLARELALLW